MIEMTCFRVLLFSPFSLFLSLLLHSHFSLSSSNHIKVDVTVHFELICKHSRSIVIEQAIPAWRRLSSIMNLHLIPYGNTKIKLDKNVTHQMIPPKMSLKCQHGPQECVGDTLMSCATTLLPEVHAFAFIECLYIHKKWWHPEIAGPQCAAALNLDWKLLNQCASSDIGKVLQWRLNDEMKHLNPKHKYVPWVLINGKHFEETQHQAYHILTQLVCETYEGVLKPKACGKPNLDRHKLEHVFPDTKLRCDHKTGRMQILADEFTDRLIVAGKPLLEEEEHLFEEKAQWKPGDSADPHAGRIQLKNKAHPIVHHLPQNRIINSNTVQMKLPKGAVLLPLLGIVKVHRHPNATATNKPIMSPNSTSTSIISERSMKATQQNETFSDEDEVVNGTTRGNLTVLETSHGKEIDESEMLSGNVTIDGLSVMAYVPLGDDKYAITNPQLIGEANVNTPLALGLGLGSRIPANTICASESKAKVVMKLNVTSKPDHYSESIVSPIKLESSFHPEVATSIPHLTTTPTLTNFTAVISITKTPSTIVTTEATTSSTTIITNTTPIPTTSTTPISTTMSTTAPTTTESPITIPVSSHEPIISSINEVSLEALPTSSDNKKEHINYNIGATYDIPENFSFRNSLTNPNEQEKGSNVGSFSQSTQPEIVESPLESSNTKVNDDSASMKANIIPTVLESCTQDASLTTLIPITTPATIQVNSPSLNPGFNKSLIPKENYHPMELFPAYSTSEKIVQTNCNSTTSDTRVNITSTTTTGPTTTVQQANNIVCTTFPPEVYSKVSPRNSNLDPFQDLVDDIELKDEIEEVEDVDNVEDKRDEDGF